MSDGTDTATATVTLIVGAANDAPVAVDDNYTVAEDGTLIADDADGTANGDANDNGVGANDSDADGDTLTYVLLSTPGDGAVTLLADGTFEYTPDANFNGTDSFTYRVLDGNGGANDATVTIGVTSEDDAPVLDPIGDQSIVEENELTFTAVANDVDGDTIAFSLSGAPAGATIDPSTGVFSFTPTEAQGPGTYTFDVVATAGGLSDSETITVTVLESNSAPVVDTPIADVSVLEDAADEIIDLSMVFSDAEDATLSYVAVSGDDTLVIVSIVGDMLTLDFQENQNGHTTVTVTATDSDGQSVTDTFNVMVDPVNDAPVVDAGITDQTAVENQFFSFAVPTDAFADVEDPSLVLTATLGNGDPLPSWLSFDGTTFEGTPAINDPNLTITVTATDSGSLSTTDTFIVTVDDAADLDGPQVTGVLVNSTAWTTDFRDFVFDETINDAGPGYQIPTGSSDQTTTLPWININQIMVEFNEDVSASINPNGTDFSLEVVAGQRADSTTASVPSIISARWVATPNGGRVVLTLNQSIEPAIIRVIADDVGITDAAGNPLNGEWTDGSSTISGDTVAGGDFRFEMRVLPGDVIKTGASNERVNEADISEVRSREGFGFLVLGGMPIGDFEAGEYDRFSDLNGDQRIQTTDVTAAQRRNGSRLLSDDAVAPAPLSSSIQAAPMSSTLNADQPAQLARSKSLGEAINVEAKLDSSLATEFVTPKFAGGSSLNLPAGNGEVVDDARLRNLAIERPVAETPDLAGALEANIENESLAVSSNGQSEQTSSERKPSRTEMLDEVFSDSLATKTE